MAIEVLWSMDIHIRIGAICRDSRQNQKGEKMISYFKAETVNDRITCIRSLSSELMYLIEGEREALLMDTCLGCGSIRTFVEGLTDKPLTVVLSHGHIDHAMGFTGLFEAILVVYYKTIRRTDSKRIKLNSRRRLCMERKYPNLCKPITIGRTTFRNRMFSAPMGGTDITNDGCIGPKSTENMCPFPLPPSAVWTALSS